MMPLHIKYPVFFRVAIVLTSIHSSVAADDFSSVTQYFHDEKLMVIVNGKKSLYILNNPKIKDSSPTYKVVIGIDDAKNTQAAYSNYVKLLKTIESKNKETESLWVFRISRAENSSAGYYQRSSLAADRQLAELIEVTSSKQKVNERDGKLIRRVQMYLRHSK